MIDKAIEILVVENDIGDADLVKEFLDEAEVSLNLNVIADGVMAVAYLRQTGQYASAVRPNLILLDLHLPGKDGFEVLTEIKNDQDLRRIPVIILSSSDVETDILRSYELGANSYVTKPVGLDQFAQMIKSIEDFWLTMAKLP